jgi:riboflavin kinase/FMN adenylyltransferase
VYAGWLSLLDPSTGERAGEAMPAAISVGTNPTFDGERDRRVEAYVIPATHQGQDERDLDLYDKLVEVAFVARIRGMVKFDGVDALVETMNQDVVRARELLAGEA